LDAGEASRGSAIKLAADVAGRCLGLGTALLITRALTVGDLGRFEIAAALAVLAAEAADLGLSATSARDLVAGRVSIRAVLRAKLLLSAAAATVLPVLVLAGGFEPLTIPLLAYFVLGGWAEWLGVVLRVRDRPLLEAITLLVLRAGVLAAVAVTLWGRPNLPWLAAAHAVATIASVAVGGVLAWQFAGRRGGPDPGPVAVVRAARPLAVNSVLALLSLRIELLALGAWGAAGDAGLYAPASKLVSFLLVIPAAVCAGAMPALVREIARGQRAARERTATTLGLIAAPAAVGLWLVPGVVLIFGEQYAEAVRLVRILAFAVPMVFLNALMLHTLVAAGRGGRVARLTAVRVTVAAAAAAVLVPAAGVSGAALGFMLAELALLWLGHRACADAGVRVPILRPILAGLVLSAPMAVLVAVLHAPDLVKVAAGAGAYAATLFGAKILRSTLASPR